MTEIDYSVRVLTDADIGLCTGKNPLVILVSLGLVALMITLSVITIIHLLFTEAEELLIKYETFSGKLLSAAWPGGNVNRRRGRR